MSIYQDKPSAPSEVGSGDLRNSWWTVSI